MRLDSKKKLVFKKVIVLSLIIISGISAVVVILKQRNNISALHYALNCSEEDREQLQRDNNELIADIVEKLNKEGIGLLTDDEVSSLKNGDLTEEQVLEIIGNRSNRENNVLNASEPPEYESAKSDGESSDSSDNAASESKTQSENKVQSNNISSLISQIYSLRSSFSGQVDSIVSQAQADAASGKYTKSEIIGKYAGQLSSLEGPCDSQFSSLVSQIESELTKTNGDTSLISELRSAYANEKRIKKASVFSKYAK